ncbi:MarR family transcriptional regulator [Cryptosporangium sp. NPDC048952]|uniref:MarR family transcriptional regulator n=1 Tax=Cryptosporangium sp. NPDC048952 TaxID=3363961 RepID=UPI003712E013
MTDTELANQPAGYWTGVAYEAVIAFIRARQAELGFTQPQFWLLRNLSTGDLWPSGSPRSIPELYEAMATYLRPEDDLAAEAETLLERGWITRDDRGRLTITAAGDAAKDTVAAQAPAVRAAIHDGIDDADYVTTLKVLQRMIRNVGGSVA